MSLSNVRTDPLLEGIDDVFVWPVEAIQPDL